MSLLVYLSEEDPHASLNFDKEKRQKYEPLKYFLYIFKPFLRTHIQSADLPDLLSGKSCLLALKLTFITFNVILHLQ